MKKQKYAYCLLCVGLLVFALLYIDYLSALLFTISLVLPLVLRGQVRLSARRVRVGFSIPGHTVYKGEPIELTVSLKNTGLLSIPLTQVEYVVYNHYFGEKTTDIISMPVFARNSQSAVSVFTPKHAGIYTIQIVQVRYYDFFRLTSTIREENWRFEVEVRPRLLVSEARVGDCFFTQLVESEVYAKSHGGDDASEIFRLRDYQPGDKLNRVHWKLSAKEDNMVVKEPSFPLQNTISLYLELLFDKDADRTALDGVLETFCILSMLFLDAAIDHTVYWFNRDSYALDSHRILTREDLNSAIGRILQAHTYRSTTHCLVRYVEDAPDRAERALYLSPVINENLLQKLGNVQRRSLQVFHINDFSIVKFADLSQLGLPCYYVDGRYPTAALDELVL